MGGMGSGGEQNFNGIKFEFAENIVPSLDDTIIDHQFSPNK